jgi:hypothetical protein
MSEKTWHVYIAANEVKASKRGVLIDAAEIERRLDELAVYGTTIEALALRFDVDFNATDDYAQLPHRVYEAGIALLKRLDDLELEGMEEYD